MKKTVTQPVDPNLMIFLFMCWLGLLFWQSSINLPIDLEAIKNMFSLSRFGQLQPAMFFSHWANTVKLYFLLFGFGIGALGTGWAIMDWLFPSVRTRLEKAVLSLGLGFALLSISTFFLGIAGGYKPEIYAGLYVLFVSGGAWSLWKFRPQIKPRAGWWWGKKPVWEDRILGIAVLLIIMWECLAANIPEIFFDGLADHLGIPSQWIVHGGITPLPGLFFSNLPMGMEMLYTGCLQLADERLCRLLNVGLMVLASLAIFAIGRRWFGRRAGFWAQGIFLTTPLILLNAAISGVDMGTCFFTTTALIALLNIVSPTENPTSDAWLAGLLCGAAISCKYTSLFVLAPVLLIIFIVRLVKGEKVSSLTRAAVKIGMGILLVLSPWLIKNIIITGNPVYPFLYKLIPTRYLDAGKMQWLMNNHWKESGLNSWIQYIRLPWDLTFYSQNMGTFIGSVFLFFMPGYIWLSLTAKKAQPMQKVLIFMVALALVTWSSQTRMARFFISGIPLIALLSAVVLNNIEKQLPYFDRWARVGVLGLAIWGSLGAVGFEAKIWDPLGASLGLQSKEVYLQQKLMTNYYPMAQVINSLPGKTKTYVFGETRSYYINKPITTISAHDPNLLIQWLDKSSTAEDVWRKLRQAGYTHLYVHAQEAVRTRSFETYHWTPEALSRWQELLAHYLKRTTVIGQQVLYEILAQPDFNHQVKTEKPLFTYDAEVADVVNSHADQALLLTQQGLWKEAESAWKEIIKDVPGWNPPYLMLANAFQAQHREAEALQMFQKADSLTDLPPDAYSNMGILLWSFGKQKEAVRCMKQALAEAPEVDAIRKNLNIMETILKQHSR